MDCFTSNEKKSCLPGDSSRDHFIPQLGGHQQPFRKGHLTIPRKSSQTRRIARSPKIPKQDICQIPKKISGYLMLTPDYVVLMTRTFVTLEGIASVYDPEFNIYTTALPITLRRLVSPSTKEARANLRNNVPLGGQALEVPKVEGNLRTRLWGIILVF